MSKPESCDCHVVRLTHRDGCPNRPLDGGHVVDRRATPAEALIYERGGYMAIDSRGIEAVRRALPGLGFDAITDAVSRKWETEVSASFASRPSGPIVGLAAMLPPHIHLSSCGVHDEGACTCSPPAQAAWCAEHGSECARDQSNCRPEAEPKCSRCGGHCTSDATCRPTPAAMLGEAEDLLRRAGDLLLFVSRDMPSNHRLDEAKGAASNAHSFTLDVLHDLKREAEAREKPPEGMCTPHRMFLCPTCHANPPKASAPDSCWQCEAPLGTTEKCLMCAAKRREGGR